MDTLASKLNPQLTVAQIAKHCDCSPQAVYKWLKLGRVPAKKVLTVERLTGVPRHELNPDLYPAETTAS